MAAQKFWEAHDGTIGIKSPKGVERKKRKNRKIGSIRGGHFFDVGDSPWSHSYERSFQEVDNNLFDAFQQSIELAHSGNRHLSTRLFDRWGLTSTPIKTANRLVELKFDHKLAYHLLRGIFSIVIRSPGFRFQNSHGRSKFGIGYEPKLGVFEVNRRWMAVDALKDFSQHGFDVVLCKAPVGREYYIGDGFFDSIVHRSFRLCRTASRWVPILRGSCVFPLSPDILAVLVFRGGARPSAFFSIEVDTTEFGEFGDLTQIVSHKELYFRNHEPPTRIHSGQVGSCAVWVEPWSLLGSLHTLLFTKAA